MAVLLKSSLSHKWCHGEASKLFSQLEADRKEFHIVSAAFAKQWTWKVFLFCSKEQSVSSSEFIKILWIPKYS